MTVRLLKVKGADLVYVDYTEVERTQTGAVVAGTFNGKLKVKGTYLHYMDNNDAQRRLLGLLTGQTGTAGKLWIKGQCLYYIDNDNDERKLCPGYSFTAYRAGTLTKSNANYTTTHDAASADSYSTTNYLVGQRHFAGKYSIYRMPLVWDTSLLPDDLTITSATIRLRCSDKVLDIGDFDVVVVCGADIEDIPVVADYGDLLNDVTGRSTVNTSAMTIAQWVEFELDATGINEINKTGLTKFALRSSEDISTTAPGIGDTNFVRFFASTSFAQLLINQ